MGGTVEELKERMSYREFLSWCAYRNKRGPLNPMLRNDAALGRIAVMVNRGLGGSAEFVDFVPWARDEVEESHLSDVMTLLAGGKRG